jgi:hypothetical protein
VANNQAVPEGLGLLRRGGRLVHIGVGGSASLPVHDVPEEMTLHTIRSSEPRHWLPAIDFLASRKHLCPFEEMVSASYALDQANDPMQAMARYEVVKWSSTRTACAGAERDRAASPAGERRPAYPEGRPTSAYPRAGSPAGHELC